MEEGMMETLKDKESFLYQFWGETMLKLIPLGNFGTGNDIKGAVVFLASEASRYISGAKIVVDGAFTVNAGI
jgi:2-deoxy-D-gluconate 3-dehydrogenase